MAKDCTSDRVLLSAHMQEHWEKVGYRPDTTDLNEVDEVNIQIGEKDPAPAPADLLRPDYSERYSSVLIKGFPKTTEEQDVYQVLLEGGLPTDYQIEKIRKDDRTGELAIDSLDPSVCLSLSNHIHGKRFFNRRVYVTSVVEKTPEKAPPEAAEPSQSDVAESSGEESEVEKTASKTPCANFSPASQLQEKGLPRVLQKLHLKIVKEIRKRKSQMGLPQNLSGLLLGRV